jgi:hypothetical protein
MPVLRKSMLAGAGMDFPNSGDPTRRKPVADESSKWLPARDLFVSQPEQFLVNIFPIDL